MIGVDLEEVERFKSLSEKVKNRVYTEQELNYCKKFVDDYVHLAGMWCCKEAVIKAFNQFELTISDIEILHNEKGVPFINQTDKLKSCMLSLGVKNIYVSISHTPHYATAIAELR